MYQDVPQKMIFTSPLPWMMSISGSLKVFVVHGLSIVYCSSWNIGKVKIECQFNNLAKWLECQENNNSLSHTMKNGNIDEENCKNIFTNR